MYIFTHCLKIFVIIKGFLLGTVIFYNNKLDVRVSGFFENGINACF